MIDLRTTNERRNALRRARRKKKRATRCAPQTFKGAGVALLTIGGQIRKRHLLKAYPELCCEALVYFGSEERLNGSRCQNEWTRLVQHEGRARKVCWRHEGAFFNPERARPVEFI